MPLRLDILPPAQRRLWAELGGLPRHFVLYGGTALALRLGHRSSLDFDFFSQRPLAPEALEREVPFLRGAERLQVAPNTLTSLVDRGEPVRVSFFGALSLRRVQDPERVEPPGVWIASLLDLAATKVKTVQDRAEAKDYLDVDALLRAGLPLAQALGAATAAWGEGFNPLLSLKALSYFGDGDLATLPQKARQRLLSAVRRTDPAELPHISPLLGELVPEEAEP